MEQLSWNRNVEQYCLNSSGGTVVVEQLWWNSKGGTVMVEQ